jgi:predicted lipoprotein with Yx(FWY)xxD motif
MAPALGSVGRPPRRPRRAELAMALVAVGVAVAAAGCGGQAAKATPQYELQARAIPGLGKIVTDGKGFTLYMYAPDHRGLSRCYEFCAQQWPPLVLPRGITQPEAGPGLDKALVGTVRRSNGTLQETYGGWPLYLWQGDTAPGEATGQAYDMGLWYVLSVTGAVDHGTPLS